MRRLCPYFLRRIAPIPPMLKRPMCMVKVFLKNYFCEIGTTGKSFSFDNCLWIDVRFVESRLFNNRWRVSLQNFISLPVPISTPFSLLPHTSDRITIRFCVSNWSQRGLVRSTIRRLGNLGISLTGCT